MKGIYEQANSALALGRISARLNAQLDLQTVLHTVCEESAMAMDAEMSSVRLHDPATNTLPSERVVAVCPDRPAIAWLSTLNFFCAGS